MIEFMFFIFSVLFCASYYVRMSVQIGSVFSAQGGRIRSHNRNIDGIFVTDLCKFLSGEKN